MISHTLQARLPRILEWGVAHRVLPFSAGAGRVHRYFQGKWQTGAPTTLNEKIQYKIIHDRRRIVKIYSDKLASRDYVHELMPSLALPRLLAVFDNPRDVLANIPRGPWVMKGSHGAGMVLIQKPSETISHEVIRAKLEEWFATDYALAHWEWQYFRLPKRIFFEEYLGTEANPPADYKFFTIHQKVRLITVDQGRFGNHTRDLFYPDWTHIRSRKGAAQISDVPPPRPELLPQLIRTAETLARDHDFIRVDLYVIDGEICFGELTHSPAAGTVPFEDPELDLQLGSYWKPPADYGD